MNKEHTISKPNKKISIWKTKKKKGYQSMHCRYTCKNEETSEELTEKDSEKSNGKETCKSHVIKSHEDEQINKNIQKEKASKTTDMILFKIIIFILLIIQTVAFSSIVRWKKIKKINCPLENDTIIIFSEIIKFFCSLILFFSDMNYNFKYAYDYINQNIFQNKRLMSFILIPSVLYYIQNMCLFFSIALLSSPVVQIIYQFRIFSVIFFSFLILKTKFKNRQLISVIFIFLSIIALQTDNQNNSSLFKKHTELTQSNTNIFYNSNENGINNEQRRNLNSFYNFHFKNTKYKVFVNDTLILNSLIKKELTNKVLFYITRRKRKGSRNFGDIRLNTWEGRFVNFQKEIEIEYFEDTGENFQKGKKQKDKTYMKEFFLFGKYNYRTKSDIENIAITEKLKQLKKKKKKYKDALLGIISIFLGAVLSGFSNVLLNYIYKQTIISFWLQNAILAFYSILIGWSWKKLKITNLLNQIVDKKLENTGNSGNHKNYDEEKWMQKLNNYENITEYYSKSENITKKEEKKENIANQKNFIFKYYHHYFNSFSEFLLTVIIIFLNSLGGLLVAIMIRCSSGISRFFVTPISLLLNVYISSICFKDFPLTLNSFIALICVMISLFLYFEIPLNTLNIDFLIKIWK